MVRLVSFVTNWDAPDSGPESSVESGSHRKWLLLYNSIPECRSLANGSEQFPRDDCLQRRFEAKLKQCADWLVEMSPLPCVNGGFLMFFHVVAEF